ncbi:MAG: TPR end-of-group domain-containing protein, partial [Terriglobia bacterium]
IFAVQDSISERVAQALTLELTGEEKKRLMKRYTENTEAYQAYLKGRYFWNKRTDEGFKKAIGYFEQAIEIDPSYALAYAGLGDCYHLLALYGLLPANESFPQAKAAVTKALEIDATLAEARASLAFIRLNYDWDWSGAEGEFKRALALNPNYATAHQWYGWQLMLMGRQEESFAEMKRAQQLDPFSLAIHTDLGLYFCYTGQYDRAIEQFRKTLEMEPNLKQVHAYLWSVYVRKGMYKEALDEAEKALTSSTTTTSGMIAARRNELAELREAYAVSGIKGYWQKGIELEKERAKRERTAIIPGNMASYYANLGDKDQALQWLEKAYQDRSNQMLYLKVDQWDGCRSDPRFTDLMRRVGLSP